MLRSMFMNALALLTAMIAVLVFAASAQAAAPPKAAPAQAAAAAVTEISVTEQVRMKVEAGRMLDWMENKELPRYELKVRGQFMKVMVTEERNMYRFALVTAANRAQRDSDFVKRTRAVATLIEKIWTEQSAARKQVDDGERLPEIFE